MPKNYAPRKAAGKRKNAARRLTSGKGFSVGTFGAGALFGGALAVALIYGPDFLPALPIIGKAQADAPTGQPNPPALTYQFMNLLPNEEVLTDVTPFDVADVADVAVGREIDISPANVTAPAVAAHDSVDLSAGSPSTKEYLLQAASFRNRDEADAMRAELLLEGMVAAVNAVSNPDGGAWHRVMVGPFSSKVEMERTLTRLRSKDISALPVARAP